jgi:glycosyltransferase involved in cell wall biosynthesis
MRKLVYLITEDWFFVSHFLPMARAARAAGFDVVVATRVRRHGAAIEAAGFRVVAIEAERRSLGPLELVRTVLRLTRLLRAERPAIVHAIALRMIVLGGLAAWLSGTKALVLAPTGLGYLWSENGLAHRVMRAATRLLVGGLRLTRRTRYLFENPEDPREFGLDPADSSVTLIGGAGVDPAAFPRMPEPPAPPVKVAVVARMLVSKGVVEAVAAVRRARELGAPVELGLFGSPDGSNRGAVPEQQLQAWSALPGIRWHGPTADVAGVWRGHHVALLLSHREGLPRSLIEAMAAGRAILTTDVPGCRHVVSDGVEGITVPLGDVEAAARALLQLASDPALRARLGAAAHARFRQHFTEEAVMQTITGVYRDLAGADPAQSSSNASL